MIVPLLAVKLVRQPSVYQKERNDQKVIGKLISEA